jgi:hypothetical protein
MNIVQIDLADRKQVQEFLGLRFCIYQVSRPETASDHIDGHRGK